MELKFDIKGHLVPYDKIEISIEEFEKTFVGSFDKDSTRYEIFRNYQRFVIDFQAEVTTNFTQWIDGSFVTTKENPRDIDFISFIDHEVYKKKRDLIDKKFRLKAAKELYNVDAYSLEIYPEDHKKHSISKIDLVYWHNWFSKTKKNRFKKSFPKGFIQIQY